MSTSLQSNCGFFSATPARQAHATTAVAAEMGIQDVPCSSENEARGAERSQSLFCGIDQPVAPRKGFSNIESIARWLLATARGARCRCSANSHPHAAIVFGSATAHPDRRPASVRATCEAIGLARSTYYCYQSHRSTGAIELEQKIVQRLLELRDCHPGDGYRRMTGQLQLEGFQVNRKRIARLMHLHSLTVRPSHADGHGSITVRPRQLLSANAAARDPATQQPTGPNQVWIADLAYVRIQSVLIYAAAVIDVWSREVVGYAASTHINARLPSIALHSAVRGYRELLREYGLVPVASDAAEPPALGTNLGSGLPPARGIVDVPDFASWDEVLQRAEEFIRTLFSSQRIDRLLETH
jgi:HTH-like domain